jgi:hypothetical protein
MTPSLLRDDVKSGQVAAMVTKNACGFYFDAFSSREPVPTSLENALIA